MKKILIAAVVLVIFVGAFAYLRFTGSADRADAMGATSNATAAKSDGKLAASAVLKIDPATPSAIRGTPRVQPAAHSPHMQAWLARKDWATLYKQLKAAPATAETQYLQAEILAACAKRPSPAGVIPATRDQRRADFLARIAPTDPLLAKRTAAYDLLNNDRCGDVAQIDYNETEVSRLLEASATAGDARARAWQLAKQIEQESQAASAKARAETPSRNIGGNMVSDAQFAAVRELLASQDPAVISEFRNILASTIAEGALRIGPNQESVDPPAFHQAIALVACDFGAPCGPDATQMLNGCTINARCETTNLYDHTLYYGVSPHGAQLVERYRDWLTQMISSRDFSNLNLVRIPGTNTSTFMFMGGRH